MSVHVLASLTWDPGFKGILTVVVAVAVLCGSIFVILSTNSGTRLGFQLALAGLFGWLFVMGIIWSVYGIGYKGPAPSWKVVDTVRGAPSQSRVEVADSLPLPEQLPDPLEERSQSKALVNEFPTTAKDPNLGDLVGVDQNLKDRVNQTLGPWKILETSNKYTGETQSVVSEALGPDGSAIFANGAADYVVIDSFLTGGKKGLGSDTSILNRIKYKFTSPFDVFHKPFRAAVQLQPVVPQTPKAGQAPPAPVRDPDAPVYTVILERDRGALRLPSIGFTIFTGLVFAVLASSLHSRDRTAAAQRRVAGAT